MLEMALTVNLISLLISFSGNYSIKMKKENCELFQFAARQLDILQRKREKPMLLNAVVSEARGNPQTPK